MQTAILPEFIRQAGNRRGVNEAWDIIRSSMDRGSPKTCIEARRLMVPFNEEARAEVIRAHEMMHIRLSPPSLEPWLKRGVATEQALMLAEECRINRVLQNEGFNPSEHLYDETDEINAYRYAKAKDLAGVIRVVAATHGTKTQEAVLKQIEKAGLENGELETIQGATDLSNTIAELLDNYKYNLTSDKPIGRKTKVPLTRGFLVTEKIATVLDKYMEIAEMTKRIPQLRPSRKVQDSAAECTAKFGDLVDGKASLNRMHNGNLGKVRIASDVGRAPRRIGRLLTDPYRRVFDRVKRKSGGVVLIDWSGSMSLEPKDILTILQHAPGATIAAYAHKDGSKGVPNFWVLAKDGKMVSKLPTKHGCGNGVDGPALRWALKARRFQNEMVLWVCDGAVTDGADDCFYTHLAAEAKALVTTGRVVMQKCMEDAVDFLKKLANGQVSPTGPTYVGELRRSY